jgi:hypothetical protein
MQTSVHEYNVCANVRILDLGNDRICLCLWAREGSSRVENAFVEITQARSQARGYLKVKSPGSTRGVPIPYAVVVCESLR